MSEIDRLREEVATKFLESGRVTDEIMKLNIDLDKLVLKEQLNKLDKQNIKKEVA